MSAGAPCRAVPARRRRGRSPRRGRRCNRPASGRRPAAARARSSGGRRGAARGSAATPTSNPRTTAAAAGGPGGVSRDRPGPPRAPPVPPGPAHPPAAAAGHAAPPLLASAPPALGHVTAPPPGPRVRGCSRPGSATATTPPGQEISTAGGHTVGIEEPLLQDSSRDRGKSRVWRFYSATRPPGRGGSCRQGSLCVRGQTARSCLSLCLPSVSYNRLRYLNY